MRLCSFPGCDRPHYGNGLCEAHNWQKRKGNALTPIRTIQIRNTCTFPECGRQHAAKGLCNGHYQQFKQGKQLSPLKAVIHRIECSFPGCKKPHLSKGFCRGHWDQQYRGVPLSPLKSIAPPGLYKGCCVPGCRQKHEAKGFCATHYERHRRKGDPEWDRGKTIEFRRNQMIGSVKQLMFCGHLEEFVFIPGHRLAQKSGWVRLARLYFERLSGRQCDHTDRIATFDGVPFNMNKQKRIRICPFCSKAFVRVPNQNSAYCSIGCAAGHRHGKTADDILEIRLAKAAGSTTADISKQTHIPEGTIYGILSGHTFPSIPFQKRGQTFDEYYMEAMAYRGRNTQSGNRKKCIPNSARRSESLEKPRILERGLRWRA